MKPMLASDYDEAKLRFPLIAQPKIDGVRALNMSGRLTGRSLKPFANKHTQQFYSSLALCGLDGEMAAAYERDPALCRKTTSALNSIEGKPFTLWWLFDYVHPDPTVGYLARHQILAQRLEELQKSSDPHIQLVSQHLRLMPSVYVINKEALDELDEKWQTEGYEGTIIRDPNGLHKQGRSTVREGGLLRIKRFVDAEAIVLHLEEGQTNNNEMQTNELGRTFRSSHAENMAPNGQVGTLVCKDMVTGEIINVSPGNMDVATRKMYLIDQSLIVGKTITYKHFPKGVKDKPRFPTFKCIRDQVDMSS